MVNCPPGLSFPFDHHHLYDGPRRRSLWRYVFCYRYWTAFLTEYVDLYGDDNEFVVPTESTKEDSTKYDEPSGEVSPPPAPIPTIAHLASSTSSKPSPPPAKPATAYEQLKSPSSISNENAPQPIQAYNSTNQDYPQRNNDSYRSLHNDAYQQQMDPTLSIVDRHVRPSEMKEEG